MYTGNLSCPRCQASHWHRDELTPTPTGVRRTELICIKCREKLEVRSTKEDSTRCIVCCRWTWTQLGRLKPKWQVWCGDNRINPPVYKGE
jgi:hypothetical protein